MAALGRFSLRTTSLPCHLGATANNKTSSRRKFCCGVDGALKQAVGKLQESGIETEEAGRDCSWLMADTLGGTSLRVLNERRHTRLSAKEFDKFDQAVRRRAERVPVQYIVGNWDFYGLTLQMQPPILIPRPETENLVELVLDALSDLAPTPSPAPVNVLDIGCGTGAVGLALLSELPSHFHVVAVDINPAACALTRVNADELNLGDRLTCYEGGIIEFANECGQQQFHTVVSNPPYIPRSDYLDLEPEVKWNEDERALCGGDDGLDVVKEILASLPTLLHPGGSRTCWLELDSSQVHPFDESLLESCGGTVVPHRDVFGKWRFAEVRLPR